MAESDKCFPVSLNAKLYTRAKCLQVSLIAKSYVPFNGGACDPPINVFLLKEASSLWICRFFLDLIASITNY